MYKTLHKFARLTQFFKTVRLAINRKYTFQQKLEMPVRDTREHFPLPSNSALESTDKAAKTSFFAGTFNEPRTDGQSLDIRTDMYQLGGLLTIFIHST